jgi:hypothetical protein
VVARAYPEFRNRHLVPDLRTYASNPLAAEYTQVAQKGYSAADGRSVPGRTEVEALNGTFDDVYAAGGIYSFVTHPEMLDYGPADFYERHLAHVGGRDDVWYVPIGPLYAYRALREDTAVVPLAAGEARARFAVETRLNRRVYSGSLTFEFHATVPVRVVAGGRELPERPAAPVARWDGEYVRRAGCRLYVTVQPNTVVEFR